MEDLAQIGMVVEGVRESVPYVVSLTQSFMFVEAPLKRQTDSMAKQPSVRLIPPANELVAFASVTSRLPAKLVVPVPVTLSESSEGPEVHAGTEPFVVRMVEEAPMPSSAIEPAPPP